jgi:hypothetical protein
MIVSGCFFLTVALIIWGFPRGFDIQDEGYMLMAIRHPELYPNLTSSFHLIAHRLFGWLNPGVYTLRVIVLVMKLGAVSVFCVGLWQWGRPLETMPPEGD